MPSAGAFRDRLRFQSPHPFEDEFGNVVEGWDNRLETDARIMPLRGGESVMADRLAGRQPVIIQVVSDSATREIDAAWQAVDVRNPDRIYQVKAPPANMDERNIYLDILAEIGVGA